MTDDRLKKLVDEVVLARLDDEAEHGWRDAKRSEGRQRYTQWVEIVARPTLEECRSQLARIGATISIDGDPVVVKIQFTETAVLKLSSADDGAKVQRSLVAPPKVATLRGSVELAVATPDWVLDQVAFGLSRVFG